MFLISFFLFACLTTTFAQSLFPNINDENPQSFAPQQVPPTTQGDQLYSPNAPQLFMQGNPNVYPMPLQPMMQGFQSPFPFNPLNQQQLSLLLMSTYARMIALTQLINMQQNKYQPFGQFSSTYPAVNNFGPAPVPLPYAQQPQVEPQNNLQNEILQQQQQEAESQHRALLEERRIQREYDMEIQRREGLMKRKTEEEELEEKQKEIERQLRDEQELEREIKEAEQQILEEQQQELEKKENDRKLRQKEELRYKRIDEQKLKQNLRNKHYTQKVNRKQRK